MVDLVTDTVQEIEAELLHDAAPDTFDPMSKESTDFASKAADITTVVCVSTPAIAAYQSNELEKAAAALLQIRVAVCVCSCLSRRLREPTPKIRQACSQFLKAGSQALIVRVFTHRFFVSIITARFADVYTEAAEVRRPRCYQEHGRTIQGESGQEGQRSP